MAMAETSDSRKQPKIIHLQPAVDLPQFPAIRTAIYLINMLLQCLSIERCGETASLDPKIWLTARVSSKLGLLQDELMRIE
jgi:hypothetical protein